MEVATGGVSRDAVHIHAKIVSTRNREISILGDVQPYLGCEVMLVAVGTRLGHDHLFVHGH